MALRTSAGNGPCENGCGTVFTIDTTGDETVIHNFTGYPGDGQNPNSILAVDADGDVYGTTTSGGRSGSGAGGVVFKIDTAGNESIVYTFCSLTNCKDGNVPNSVTLGSDGNLYGTTLIGGANQRLACSDGCGTVFKVTTTGAETVLYSFRGGKRAGGAPVGGVLRDKAGNLYGAASWGGYSEYGIIFRLSPTGTETKMHIFTGGADGGDPEGSLVQDKHGNFYGVTGSGGTSGLGVLFKLNGRRRETVLHSFSGSPNDGSRPAAPVLLDGRR